MYHKQLKPKDNERTNLKNRTERKNQPNVIPQWLKYLSKLRQKIKNIFPEIKMEIIHH